MSGYEKKNLQKRSISEEYFNWPVSHSKKEKVGAGKNTGIINKIKEYLLNTGERL